MNNIQYQLEQLVGKRFIDLDHLKSEIEKITNEKVNEIMESESERMSGTDFMIDFDLEKRTEVYTIYYLRDNSKRYYITEV